MFFVVLALAAPREVTRGETSGGWLLWRYHIVILEISVRTEYKVIIWNECVCDYITLTTFDVRAYGRLVECAAVVGISDDGDPIEARMMQYDGLRFKSGFIGKGMQKGLTHHIVTVSGALSGAFLREVMSGGNVLDSLVCTRLDIQLTVSEGSTRNDSNDIISGIFERVNAAYETMVDEKGGRPRKTLHMNGRQYGSTVYIGAMGADRLIRCYEKQGIELYGIRYEAQLRGAISRLAFVAIVNGLSIEKLLKGELTLVPDTRVVFPGFWGAVDRECVQPIRVITGLTDIERKIVWLHRQVSPTLVLLRNELGDRAFNRLLANLCEESLTGSDGGDSMRSEFN